MAEEQDKDFKGETNFRDLSPEQKLLWLSQAALFVLQYKGRARKEPKK
jgi:hypothetical protein